ncbi:MAG TPA: hypothetical protein VK186_20585 [Candidatus Deferrimicrobium sp.]|nr:hypothetical protein [Candidatus Deferrimicrobium sp.]
MKFKLVSNFEPKGSQPEIDTGPVPESPLHFIASVEEDKLISYGEESFIALYPFGNIVFLFLKNTL